MCIWMINYAEMREKFLLIKIENFRLIALIINDSNVLLSNLLSMSVIYTWNDNSKEEF